jgi:hypothetical protein
LIVKIGSEGFLSLGLNTASAALPTRFNDTSNPRIQLAEKEFVLLDWIRTTLTNWVALKISRTGDIDDLD